jgi:hypothetical protein
VSTSIAETGVQELGPVTSSRVSSFLLQPILEKLSRVTETVDRENYRGRPDMSVEPKKDLAVLIHNVEGRTVFQPIVNRQHNQNSCGYYALFNASIFLSATSSPTPAQSVQHLTKLVDSAAFGSYYMQVTQFLKAKANAEGNRCYPWKLQSIEQEILERLHAYYLLDHFPFIQKLGGKDTISLLPDLCLESLKSGLFDEESLRGIQIVFDQFVNSKTYRRVFLVGSINHWVAVCVNKFQDALEFIYMDSRNYDISRIENSIELHKMVNQFLDSDSVSTSEEAREDRHHAHVQSLVNTLFSVKLIYDCIIGKQNILHVAYDLTIFGILESFEECVGKRENHNYNDNIVNDTNESWGPATMEDLCKWLREGCHPSVLENQLLGRIEKLGVEVLSSKTKEKLRKWLCCVMDCLASNTVSADSGDNDLVLRLKRVVGKLEVLAPLARLEK